MNTLLSFILPTIIAWVVIWPFGAIVFGLATMERSFTSWTRLCAGLWVVGILACLVASGGGR